MPRAPRYRRPVRYAVTVEPKVNEAHPDARPVRATIDADDKDEALARAEIAYRRMHPAVRQLRMSVVRVRPPVNRGASGDRAIALRVETIYTVQCFDETVTPIRGVTVSVTVTTADAVDALAREAATSKWREVYGEDLPASVAVAIVTPDE